MQKILNIILTVLLITAGVIIGTILLRGGSASQELTNALSINAEFRKTIADNDRAIASLTKERERFKESERRSNEYIERLEQGIRDQGRSISELRDAIQRATEGIGNAGGTLGEIRRIIEESLEVFED